MKPRYLKIDSFCEESIIQRYRAGESLREIAKDSPVGRTAIARVLRLNNVPLVGTGNARGRRKYPHMIDFFDTIDSESKAYWLGFICADGHVSDEGVQIVLQASDAGHLQKFASALGTQAPIVLREPNRAIFASWSKRMVADLRGHGLRHDKSLTLDMPVVPNDLYRHFLRGFFDGDGCLKVYSRMKKRYVNPAIEYSVGFCGTPSIVFSIRKILHETLGVSLPKIQNRQTIRVVEWSGRLQCLKILDWMYDDAKIFLDRKYTSYRAIRS